MKRNTLNRSLALTALLMLAAGVLSACNTVKGVGKDLQAAGSGVSHGAEESSDAIFDEDKK